MANFAEDFIRLCLRLNKHIPGLVDSYFGPDEFKIEVDAEEIVPLPELREDCRELMEAERTEDGDHYLSVYREKQVDALAAQIDRLSEPAKDYYAYVHRLFDIDLAPVPEQAIDDYHQKIKALLRELGHEGRLGDTLLRWEESNYVSGDELEGLIASVCRDARKRTRQIIPLPRSEKVTIEMVRSKPWSGYNWYQGRYRSLIQVNLDLPRTRFEAEDLAHHEAYPGHHTDHSSKEKALYRERRLLETSIMLINTPVSVLSEGIASVAGKFISPPNVDDARRLATLVRELRRACDSNATIKLHADNAGVSTVAEYLEKRGLMSHQRVTKRLEFLTNSLWSSYSFTYWFGSRIVENAYERAKIAGVTQEFFKLLYTEPLVPTTLEERLRKLC
jgi:hypothetical protein